MRLDIVKQGAGYEHPSHIPPPGDTEETEVWAARKLASMKGETLTMDGTTEQEPRPGLLEPTAGPDAWGGFPDGDALGSLAKTILEQHRPCSRRREDGAPDLVNHPPHYQGKGGLQAIDVIEAFGLDYCLGNACKYILRAGKKGCAAQDLRKAAWYLERRAKQLEGADGDGG